jgi:hypothetical protein
VIRGDAWSCRRQEFLYVCQEFVSVCCCDLHSSAPVVAEVSRVAAALRRETVCGVVIGGHCGRVVPANS